MYVKSQINLEFLENYSITPEAKKSHAAENNNNNHNF